MSTENVKPAGYQLPELFLSMVFLGENPNISFYFFDKFFDGLVLDPPKGTLVENTKREWYKQGKSLMKAFTSEERDPSKISKKGFGSFSSYEETAAIAAVTIKLGLRPENLDSIALTLLSFVQSKWKFILIRGKSKMFHEYNRVYPNHNVTEKQFNIACAVSDN